MNILFMIGNGFDINLGMKTSYSNFYEYYLSIPCDNNIINKFKKDIDNPKNKKWSDLELALGKYSINIDNEDDYILIIEDINKNLKEYLASENNNYVIDVLTDFVKSELMNFVKYFSNKSKATYNSYVKEECNKNYNFISFNYTNTLEKIFKVTPPLTVSNKNINNKLYSIIINKIIHVHGTLNDSMILGVNDETQISNFLLRTNRVKEYLIKPEMNENSETLRDEECSKLISEANIVIIYGMSIGDTDKYWWEMLMKKFISDPEMIIVIVNYDENYESVFKHLYIQKKRDIKEKLLKYVKNIDKNITVRQELEKRIIVELNTNMFNFKIKKKQIAA